MKTPILELENISYAYDDQPNALQNITVSIYPGERIAIVGNNGAGKSTFFLCCNGVLFPQKGKIILHSKEINNNKKDLNCLRQHVGIVFQDPNQQLIGATVEEEISFGPMNLLLPIDEVERRTNDAIVKMDLEKLRDRPPHYLSGGEKRRLTIADVLTMDPDIVIMDEPTAFLDSKNTYILENTLNELCTQGKTLMVASHDMDFVWRWSSRVLVFHDGKIIADDTPENIFSNDCLLNKAQIQQPLLFKITKALLNKELLDLKNGLPTTLDELIKML